MTPLRGVGPRLSLALAGVVAGALAISYLIVVPSLRDRLVDARLQHLERFGHETGRTLAASQFEWQDAADETATRADARVVVYAVDRVRPPALRVVGDSRGHSSTDVAVDPLAERSVARLRVLSGEVDRDEETFAEVALPVLRRGAVITLSSSLHDSLADVHLVQRRLVLAGAIALVVAAAIGYVGSWVFARRIRRLERAADRIARGQFEQPVVDGGADELGELAAAFDRMRERLAMLDHARREFIANASHELRTPLFSLGGFLELLDDEELDEETRQEFLTTMAGQVRRLTKLATELLDLSRLDAGRMRVVREPFDLAEVARAAVAEFAAVARSADVPLAVDAPAPVPALGDEQRALEVARNLVENALVHSRAPVRVWVRAAGERALLAVEDEGRGIPPEHASQVFDRFYRVDGTVASGSGLGLAIARELAALMGGTLELESRPGRTIFHLALVSAALPLAHPVAAADSA